MRDVLEEWEEERRAARARRAPAVEAVPGVVAEHRASGFAGAVVGADATTVTLRDRTGRERTFKLDDAAFRTAAGVVTLVRPAPRPAAPSGPVFTASGSVAGARGPQVARAGRLLVEGRHDAELLEHVWGDDLRHEGVVVEVLEGADHLADVVRAFAPGPDRRLGVLLDHLVPGSKESRLADAVAGPHVLVTGTPYVDVWQAVRPHVLGMAAWPTVPRGTDWKTGICAALGEPDPARLWVRIKHAVRTYADLEPSLVGAVERLIDFVTTPAGP